MRGGSSALARTQAARRHGASVRYFDLDAFDPAFAPGAGTPEPGGLTTREVFPILRALGMQNDIVGMDLVEINPLVDSGYQTTALVGQRVMREILSGMAMRKQGITDPRYIHPHILNHTGNGN